MKKENVSGKAVWGAANSERRSPWVEMKTFSFHPTIYRTMLGKVSHDAQAGDLVTVYDRKGNVFGSGLYNPRARVPLRMYRHGEDVFEEEDLIGLIDRSVALRRDVMNLDEFTQAYRAIHSDGDGLSGLVVDKLGDTLSVQVHSLGIYQRLQGWIPVLKNRLSASQVVVEVDPRVADLEEIVIDESLSFRQIRRTWNSLRGGFSRWP